MARVARRHVGTTSAAATAVLVPTTAPVTASDGTTTVAVRPAAAREAAGAATGGPTVLVPAATQIAGVMSVTVAGIGPADIAVATGVLAGRETSTGAARVPVAATDATSRGHGSGPAATRTGDAARGTDPARIVASSAAATGARVAATSGLTGAEARVDTRIGVTGTVLAPAVSVAAMIADRAVTGAVKALRPVVMEAATTDVLAPAVTGVVKMLAQVDIGVAMIAVRVVTAVTTEALAPVGTEVAMIAVPVATEAATTEPLVAIVSASDAVRARRVADRSTAEAIGVAPGAGTIAAVTGRTAAPAAAAAPAETSVAQVGHRSTAIATVGKIAPGGPRVRAAPIAMTVDRGLLSHRSRTGWCRPCWTPRSCAT